MPPPDPDDDRQLGLHDRQLRVAADPDRAVRADRARRRALVEELGPLGLVDVVIDALPAMGLAGVVVGVVLAAAAIGDPRPPHLRRIERGEQARAAPPREAVQRGPGEAGAARGTAEPSRQALDPGGCPAGHEEVQDRADPGPRGGDVDDRVTVEHAHAAPATDGLELAELHACLLGWDDARGRAESV